MKVILKNSDHYKIITTKFQREIGFKMRIDGTPFTVIYFGDDEDVNFAWGVLLKKINQHKRVVRKIRLREENMIFAKILKESIDNLKREGINIIEDLK